MGKPNVKAFTTKITSATTDTQIFTAPWRNRKRYIITKMIICNENAAQAVVKFFDDDLADATTPARGDHTAAPLLEVCVPIQSTTNGGTLYLEEKQIPAEFYQGGLVAYSSVNNVVVSVEVRTD